MFIWLGPWALNQAFQFLRVDSDSILFGHRSLSQPFPQGFWWFSVRFGSLERMGKLFLDFPHFTSFSIGQRAGLQEVLQENGLFRLFGAMSCRFSCNPSLSNWGKKAATPSVDPSPPRRPRVRTAAVQLAARVYAARGGTLLEVSCSLSSVVVGGGSNVKSATER